MVLTNMLMAVIIQCGDGGILYGPSPSVSDINQFSFLVDVS